MENTGSDQLRNLGRIITLLQIARGVGLAWAWVEIKLMPRLGIKWVLVGRDKRRTWAENCTHYSTRFRILPQCRDGQLAKIDNRNAWIPYAILYTILLIMVLTTGARI